MTSDDRRPRTLDETIDRMDCTEEVRARLRAKLAAARESTRRAIEGARARSATPRRPDEWLTVGDVAQRVRAAVEEARHEPAMTPEEAIATFEGHFETKH